MILRRAFNASLLRPRCILTIRECWTPIAVVNIAVVGMSGANALSVEANICEMKSEANPEALGSRMSRETTVASFFRSSEATQKWHARHPVHRPPRLISIQVLFET